MGPGGIPGDRNVNEGRESLTSEKQEYRALKESSSAGPFIHLERITSLAQFSLF
jgi:hypothetical protein